MSTPVPAFFRTEARAPSGVAGVRWWAVFGFSLFGGSGLVAAGAVGGEGVGLAVGLAADVADKRAGVGEEGAAERLLSAGDVGLFLRAAQGGTQNEMIYA